MINMNAKMGRSTQISVSFKAEDSLEVKMASGYRKLPWRTGFDGTRTTETNGEETNATGREAIESSPCAHSQLS